MINSSYDALYANSACVLKFMADDDRFTSKRIMMRIDRLNFSRCEGTKLSVYFDRDSYGGPDVSSLKRLSNNMQHFYGTINR